MNATWAVISKYTGIMIAVIVLSVAINVVFFSNQTNNKDTSQQTSDESSRKEKRDPSLSRFYEGNKSNILQTIQPSIIDVDQKYYSDLKNLAQKTKDNLDNKFKGLPEADQWALAFGRIGLLKINEPPQILNTEEAIRFGVGFSEAAKGQKSPNAEQLNAYIKAGFDTAQLDKTKLDTRLKSINSAISSPPQVSPAAPPVPPRGRLVPPPAPQ